MDSLLYHSIDFYHIHKTFYIKKLKKKIDQKEQCLIQHIDDNLKDEYDNIDRHTNAHMSAL